MLWTNVDLFVVWISIKGPFTLLPYKNWMKLAGSWVSPLTCTGALYFMAWVSNDPPTAATMTSLWYRVHCRKKKVSPCWKSLQGACEASSATCLSSLCRSLAVMLLSFEVCEVCCDCQSHANPWDNPGHLFPGTSVHRRELYSATAQLPGSGFSIPILRAPKDGTRLFLETLFRLFLTRLCRHSAPLWRVYCKLQIHIKRQQRIKISGQK